MKRFARTGAKLAVVGIAAAMTLSACGSSTSNKAVVNGAFGSIPPEHGTPSGTGTMTLPEFAGVPPTWIFPVVNSANNSIGSVTLFQYFMWRPLWWSPSGDQQVFDYALSTGTKPIISNGGKTVTFSLNPAYKWSNGQPITANDVLFYIDLAKAAIALSPANYAGYVPGQFPLDITTKEVNSSTVAITFNKAYNPDWTIWDEVGQITPIPSTSWNVESAGGAHIPASQWEGNLKVDEKIYSYLAGLSGDKGTYASNPIWQTVDGPFKLQSFNSTSGSFTMTPNASYGGPYKAQYSTLDMNFYTDETAEYDALLDGQLDVGYVPFQNLPQLKSLKAKGFSYFGYPGMGYDYIPYNFKDTTDHWSSVISQLYVRQAIAHLQNEAAEIKGIFLGAAIPAYTSIPTLPKTPYVPADASKDPYPYSPSTTVSMLKAHGWKVVPGGQTTCAKPGTGSGECGAGIPAGTPLSFNVPYSTTPSWIGELIDSLASTAKQYAGITITPQAKTFTFIVQNYNDPVSPKYDNSWDANQFGGYTGNGYNTTNEELNSGGGGNFGDFSNPTLDQAINGSLNSTNPNALTHEAEEVGLLQPALFEPLTDNIIAWKSSVVSGPASAFQIMTQYYLTPEEFYFVK
jgi:peptide/nickel transport system substrate-binding protein